MMATASSSKQHLATIWTLRVILTVTFLTVGAAKLTGTAHTEDYFAAIGWGQWFRYLTGCVDIVGVMLVWVPRWASYGAILLACSVGSAALISLTVMRNNALWGGPEMALVPFVFAALAVTLARLLRR